MYVLWPWLFSVDILDHNKKIILGLIWSLILRYQIVGIEAGTVMYINIFTPQIWLEACTVLCGMNTPDG